MLRKRVVTRDGCLAQTWRFVDTGTVHTRGKRRPLKFQEAPELCSWHASVYCADHPIR